MKKWTVLVAASLLILVLAGFAASQTNPPAQIRICMTFDNGKAVAVLYDNPTTRSLLKQLPATVTIEDFADAEKIAYFPKSLSKEGAPGGYDPKRGDVTCYGPWGNLAIFYKDRPYASGLISMGRIESGLDKLAAQKKNFEVFVEMVE